MSMITTKVLAEMTTTATFDLDDPVFASAFTPSRGDSVIRVEVSIGSGSASGNLAMFAPGFDEVRLQQAASISQLRFYKDDLWLPRNGSWNLRSKLDGIIVNFARVTEVIPS